MNMYDGQPKRNDIIKNESDSIPSRVVLGAYVIRIFNRNINFTKEI